MIKYLDIPHRVREGLCPVNGIRDLVQWRAGYDWSNEFLWGLGQGAGFAYLRFNAASPPRQVYTGIATPRQHKYLAELLGASLNVVEGRSFKFSWEKARQSLEEEKPPVIGPLDMFHLPFYPGIYLQRHIPIHFLLLVGFENQIAYFLDTSNQVIQSLSMDDLQSAWDVSVPGIGKRNRLGVFDIPQYLPPVAELIRQAVSDQCQTMLSPPVSMLGIPAMRKVAREIIGWEKEFGKETTSACLDQAREYLNSPPDLEGNHLTAGRDIYITFLEESGTLSGLDFSDPIATLKASIAVVPRLADALRQHDLAGAASVFSQLADIEERAFTTLGGVVGK